MSLALDKRECYRPDWCCERRYEWSSRWWDHQIVRRGHHGESQCGVAPATSSDVHGLPGPPERRNPL